MAINDFFWREVQQDCATTFLNILSPPTVFAPVDDYATWCRYLAGLPATLAAEAEDPHTMHARATELMDQVSRALHNFREGRQVTPWARAVALVTLTRLNIQLNVNVPAGVYGHFDYGIPNKVDAITRALKEVSEQAGLVDRPAGPLGFYWIGRTALLVPAVPQPSDPNLDRLIRAIAAIDQSSTRDAAELLNGMEGRLAHYLAARAASSGSQPAYPSHHLGPAGWLRLALGGNSEQVTITAVVSALLLGLLVSAFAIGARDLVAGLHILSAFDSYTQKLAARARPAIPVAEAHP